MMTVRKPEVETGGSDLRRFKLLLARSQGTRGYPFLPVTVTYRQDRDNAFVVY